MSNYYVNGYTTPSGVTDRDDVKAIQQQLKSEKEITALLNSGLFGEEGGTRLLSFYRRAYKLYLAETAFLATEKKV